MSPDSEPVQSGKPLDQTLERRYLSQVSQIYERCESVVAIASAAFAERVSDGAKRARIGLSARLNRLFPSLSEDFSFQSPTGVSGAFFLGVVRIRGRGERMEEPSNE